MVFLVVGSITVGIDLLTYRILLWLGVEIWISKTISFITGTIFAYFSNKIWTFDRAEGGTKRAAGFLVLYGTTLLLNVLVNALVIHILGRGEVGLALGFLAATGTSATLNFLGMKFLVFRPTRDAGVG